jgi:hypothetical protein
MRCGELLHVLGSSSHTAYKLFSAERCAEATNDSCYFAGTRVECRNFQPILDFMLGLKVADEFGFRHGSVDIKYFNEKAETEKCSLLKQPKHQVQRTTGQKQKRYT